MSRVNLFLIGVNKAGTSWLYTLLDRHPDIFMANEKELYYFGDTGRDEEAPRTLEAYHRHFPFDEGYQYFGDATVMYYRHAETAEAIQAYNTDAKLLAIVRDPIERLLSQFQYHKQLGILAESTTLREALDGRDPKLLRDSHYEETLPAYAERFGPEQFTVVSLEAGKEAPDAFWDDLLHFLSLPKVPRPTGDDRPQNPTGSAAFRAVYRHTVRPLRRLWPGGYRRLLGHPAARAAKRTLLRLLGTAGSKADVLTPDLEKRLRDEFAPTYAYLHDLGMEVYDRP